MKKIGMLLYFLFLQLLHGSTAAAYAKADFFRKKNVFRTFGRGGGTGIHYLYHPILNSFQSETM